MSEILNQIKAKRHRAAVPVREDSLIQKNLTEAEGEGLVNTVSRADPTVDRPAAAILGQLQTLQVELEKYPEIIRHSAIRLEKELDSRLTRFCKESGCTIETFLEAAFEEVEADTNFRQKILSNALKRYASRKKAGKLRQLITQLEKAGV